MNTNQITWNQHANPRMCVRADGHYWVIAEPVTWDADDTDDYAARTYYGTFPYRVAEVGFVWGDTLELALANAIAHLEQRLLLDAQRCQNGGNGMWGSTTNNGTRTAAARRQFVEEWRF